MKKMSSDSADKLIMSFIIKSVCTTAVSVLLLTFLFSELMFRLDMAPDRADIMSVFISACSSFIIAYISVGKMKNKTVVLALLSEIPLLFFSLINLVFNENSVVFFLVKTAIIMLIAALTGIIKAKRNKRYSI